MLNTVILMGRLTADPDLKVTPANKNVVTFTLAVDRVTKGESDFITCVAWEKTATFMANYLKKGSKIVVQGRLQTRKYDRQDGSKAVATEVIVSAVDFGDAKKEEAKPDFDNVDVNGELPF